MQHLQLHCPLVPTYQAICSNQSSIGLPVISCTAISLFKSTMQEYAKKYSEGFRKTCLLAGLFCFVYALLPIQTVYQVEYHDYSIQDMSLKYGYLPSTTEIIRTFELDMIYPSFHDSLDEISRRSPACEPELTSKASITHIYYYHTRKAGGTSMRNYLVRVGKKYNITVYFNEGGVSPDPLNITASLPNLNSSTTLFLTTLREPVARSISNFKYSGRWSCHDLVYEKKFQPTEENANKLETWMYVHGHRPPDTKRGKCNLKVWDCAANCYISWFSNGGCSFRNYEKAFEKARTNLYNYDIIFRTEKLQEPQYTRAIETLFGLPWRDDRVMFCFKQSKRANGQNPLIVPNRTLANLVRVNSRDIKLYNELTTCPHGTRLPNISLSFYTNKET